MRVLLVHPSALMYSEIFLRLEPLGLERVASALLDAGHDVRMVDLQVYREQELRKVVTDFQPEAVGFSLNYLGNVPEVIDLAKWVRSVLPGSLVFAGGHETATDFGPLSRLLSRNGDAALVRLIPRYAGHSDFELVRIAKPGDNAAASDESKLEEAIRVEGEKLADAPAGSLDRGFYEWYWAQMAPAAG